MKKILILLLIFSSITCSSQNHLTFLDYPITGSLEEFVKVLENKGFKKTYNHGWFKKMKTKYLRGSFWQFPDCDIVVRQPKKYNNVTSVYVHPHSNFLLLNDLLYALDRKYGEHQEQYSNSDINIRNYYWSMPEGSITIFATTTYGQNFDIVYRDFTEVNILERYSELIDDDL
jgi:hypothetical protein